MGVGVVLKAVMVILLIRLFGSEFFKKTLKIPVQTAFVIVNEHACGYVHGVAKQKPFFNAAFPERRLNLRSYVNKSPSGIGANGQNLSVTFHSISLRHFLFIIPKIFILIKYNPLFDIINII
jgi:hypothetical protein